MIDADTIVVRAAMASQTNFVVYKNGKRITPTKSRLQWTKDNPDLNPDDYEFRKEATLIQYGHQPAINLCKNAVIKAVREIEAQYPEYKAWVCLEAEGNYRQQYYPDYKGQRDGDILLRTELTQWVTQTFPRVILAFGEETDDVCAKFMWLGHQNFKKTGVYTHMVASCDKDLKTVAGKLYNYCKKKEHFLSEVDADKWFCQQLLQGDNIDNIKGINGGLSKEFCTEHGLRKTKGVGDKTAENLLKSAETSKECFERVIEAYKDVHGDDWIPRLKEEGIGLRMRHVKDEIYDIRNHLTHLGIDYE